MNSKTYIAKDKDRLDTIVNTYYGSLIPFEQVLDANFFANKDSSAILAAGDKILLPDIKIEAQKQESKALWN